MRLFKLKNALGKEFDMMRTDAFFNAPDGLGAEWDMEFLSFGGRYAQVSRAVAQKPVTGEMVFKGYVQYREFAAFCAQRPLVLLYNPMGTWYSVDCELAGIGKTEIEPDTRRLICDVDFMPLGQWYRETKLYRPQPTETDAKNYDYIYPYNYADGNVNVAYIVNNGTMDAPVKIYVYGPAENPEWQLTQNGRTIAAGKVNADITDAQVLIVDPTPQEMRIAVYDRQTLALLQNVYGNSDFTTERFIYAPLGESVLNITVQSGTVEAVVEVRELAETV